MTLFLRLHRLVLRSIVVLMIIVGLTMVALGGHREAFYFYRWEWLALALFILIGGETTGWAMARAHKEPAAPSGRP
ncbi:hypothetical protein [Sphingomonas sp.]|uniref:hypothetical protein n=1 Tax=Sphingomonas sp. TaxID=28214 RepID=UPI003D6DA214